MGYTRAGPAAFTPILSRPARGNIDFSQRCSVQSAAFGPPPRWPTGDVMASTHGRTSGLGVHGIGTTGQVHWNLTAPLLYEHALRRDEGVVAADGPLVCRTGQHTGRSPNDKFVVKEPSSEAHVHWGKVNRPMAAGALRRPARRYRGAPGVEGPVRAEPARRGRPGLPPAGAFRERICLAQPVRAEPLHRAHTGRAGGARARIHRHLRPLVPGRSGPARHPVRVGDRAQHGGQGGAHRRHQLRRREQEVDLQRAQLRAAAQRRALDALLGQHRRGRRHGALLRPVRHRQDHAVERSRNAG